MAAFGQIEAHGKRAVAAESHGSPCRVTWSPGSVTLWMMSSASILSLILPLLFAPAGSADAELGRNRIAHRPLQQLLEHFLQIAGFSGPL